MYAREAVLNDPEIVKLLSELFVAVAIDNANNINLTPAEKRWLSDKGGEASTQGMFAITAGGKVLASGGGFEAEPVRKMLVEAMEKFRPDDEPAEVEPLDEEDRASIPRPPEGGLVLYVTWKVLGGYADTSPEPGTEEYSQQKSLGVDRLWVRKDEAEALAAGQFPDSLKNRMLRYHAGGIFDVEDFEVALDGDHLSGSFRSANAGEQGVVKGVVEKADGRVTRFDLLLKGPAARQRSHGFLAGLEVIPEGKRVPVALLFTLADPKDDLSLLPPHRTWRQLEIYLR